jgi:hypothetical protein
VAAFPAEFSPERNIGFTGRTFYLKLGSAFFTKFYPFTILKLTFWALHICALLLKD